MKGRETRVSSVVIVTSAALLVIGSVLPFYESSGSSQSAWGRGLFPLMTLPAFVGAVLGVLAALTLASRWRAPAQIAGLSWRAFSILLGTLALALMVGFLVGEPGATFRPLASMNTSIDTAAGISRGTGFWAMFAGAGGLLAGAALGRIR